MVSRAVDEGLVERIQRYVANDLNSKIPPTEPGQKSEPRVDPDHVYVLAFSRILDSWSAWAVSHLQPDCYYEIVHNGSTGVTLVNVYHKKTTQPAII